MKLLKNPDFTRNLLQWIHQTQKQAPLDPFVADVTPLLRQAVKFSLPFGGLIDDSMLEKHEDGTALFHPHRLPHLMQADKMHLPYPILVLELENLQENEQPRKDIILCQETEFSVIVTQFDFRHGTKEWYGLPPLKIDREHLHADTIDRKYHYGVSQLLAFLNAISCTNVQVREQKVSPVKRAMGKTIPYDDYKILTFTPNAEPGLSSGTGTGTTGWHPREHIRRGSWVTHQNGKRYWRNSCVVNAGKGYAKITKSYKIKV
jgi:hypothetical protein